MKEAYNIDNIWYLNEINMKGFALGMITFGCEAFFRAKHIKEIGSLSNLINTLDKLGSEGKMPDIEIIKEITEFGFDKIPDWARIIICFENYMKAILLMNGFLIHKIDKNQTNLKTLANNQNKRPIPLAKFLQINNFYIDIDSKNWMLDGLKPQTIDFGVLLKNNYQNEIQLPDKIIKSIIEINHERNNLHFYHQACNSYSQKFIQDLKLMDKYVNEEMVNLAKKLQNESNSNLPTQ